MGTQKSNMFDTAYNYLVPEDEILDKPTHWTPSMQAYNNSASTPIPFLYQHAAGYMPLYMWPNQANSTVLQSNVLQDPMKLSNKPTVSEDAVLAFSEIVHRTFGEQNLNSIKKCARNLQPKSLIPKESRGDGSKSSILKNNKDRVLCSEAYGNKGSLHEDLVTANDFPSTKKQHCNLVLENASSIQLNQDLETGLDAIGTNTELVKLEEDEIRRERKRQSNRESARRSRMRKERECEELHKKMEILKDENSMLTQRLKSLSEECLEICNENDAIEEELVNMYGTESISYLLAMKPR
ncbi:G-box-binding factor 1 isoform X2 [Vigna radiata var. radiata]|uniref:G-box-binding factor 1 isoform X2 n=1 Tax=Vigna radiata var. radiata TaxID=3916 RepID=A0A1S3VQQ6_VIGRR|nr:G-box-binding factor 1 isoform X2 [Vigna radiata var. radiata]XP_022643295.1 G-box-binding factor 1 isoform X2 [Vigna radiata var. radiata]